MKHLSVLLSWAFFFLLTGCTSTGQVDPNAVGSAYTGALALTQSIGNLTPEAQNLRNGLQQLSFKLNSYAAYNSAQFQSSTNAQAVSSAIASVAGQLSNSSVTNAPSEAEGIKGMLPYNLTAQQPMVIPPNTTMTSTWDAMIYPHVLVRMIRIQASYTAAMVQMLSQTIQYLTPTQIASMSNMVQGAVARLESLPV